MTPPLQPPAEPQENLVNLSLPAASSMSDTSIPLDNAITSPVIPETSETPVSEPISLPAVSVADAVAPTAQEELAAQAEMASSLATEAVTPVTVAPTQAASPTPAIAAEPSPEPLVQPASVQPLGESFGSGTAVVMGGDAAAALRMPQPLFAPVATHTHDEATSTRSPWRIAGLSLLGLAVVLVGGTVGAYISWRNSGQIANGLVIQGQSVGGLTKAEARQRLQEHFGRLFITIQTPEKPYKLGVSELGGHPQIDRLVENAYWYGRSGNLFSNMLKVYQTRQHDQRLVLPVAWNKDQLRKKMWIVATQYKRKPRDAKLEVTEHGVRILPHQEGCALNVGATLQKLQHRYYVGLPTLEATVEHVMPRLTSASLAGTDVKLGEYTTHFDSGQVGRSKNLRLAAESINGKVVMPKELFSFNKMTGERTWEKGYRMAHIFVHQPGEEKSQVIEGLAGGTCQVSSTLFNAVRKTNKQVGGHLKIVEHNHHSLPVTYVPDGLDATVAWPDKDFKFRNTSSYPVYVRTAVEGERINISLWARVPQNVSSVLLPEGTPPTTTVAAAETAGQKTATRASSTKSKAAHTVESSRRAERL